MVIAIFRSTLRDEHDAEFQDLAQEMMELATGMPGFRSYKVFVADDGERCSLIEFESQEAMLAWRNQPAHRAAQERGRNDFYESYELQVVEPLRESRFRRDADPSNA